uniref:Uncharacterized protein n=1 Tax=Cucumis melo TaxID=3656 RepID=A0A9I9CCL5_CUCME
LGSARLVARGSAARLGLWLDSARGSAARLGFRLDSARGSARNSACGAARGAAQLCLRFGSVGIRDSGRVRLKPEQPRATDFGVRRPVLFFTRQRTTAQRQIRSDGLKPRGDPKWKGPRRADGGCSERPVKLRTPTEMEIGTEDGDGED